MHQGFLQPIKTPGGVRGTSIPGKPYVALARARVEIPIAQRIELVADFKETPRGDAFKRVVTHVLEPYIAAHRDVPKPKWLGTDIDHIVDQGEHRRYAAELIKLTRPKLTSDLEQLAMHPTTDTMVHHGITDELLGDTWLRSFYDDIVAVDVVKRLAEARERYIVDINRSRARVLQQSLGLNNSYLTINDRMPDIVGLFYFFQIEVIHNIIVASHSTVAETLPALKEICIAHELPTDPYITTPAWYDWQGFSGAQRGALAMIRPLIEGELVRHYHRAVRFNWKLTSERRKLLEFGRKRQVVRQQTLDSVFDAQPPSLVGRFLAFFRRLRTRTRPLSGSMDDFLMQHSNELELLDPVY